MTPPKKKKHKTTKYMTISGHFESSFHVSVQKVKYFENKPKCAVEILVRKKDDFFEVKYCVLRRSSAFVINTFFLPFTFAYFNYNNIVNSVQTV